MKKIAIKGDQYRGNEVIKLLQMLGGKNVYAFTGTDANEKFIISDTFDDSRISILHPADCGNYEVFTLDEFYELYPYKVGDIVYNLVTKKSCVIADMRWVGYDELNKGQNVLYRCVDARTADEFTAYSYELRPIERIGDSKHQPTMNIAEILKNAPVGTKLYSPMFGEVDLNRIDEEDRHPIVVNVNDYRSESFTADGKYYADFPNSECVLFPSKENRDWSTFKVKSNFPTDICNCGAILDIPSLMDKYQYKRNELNALRELLLARDAWWKVDNDWKPDWSENNYKYVINTCKNTIDKNVAIDNSHILAFRTPTIRNKFLDTFRELIKQCKELI